MAGQPIARWRLALCWLSLSLAIVLPDAATAQLQVDVETDRSEAYVNQQILLTLVVTAPAEAFGVGGDKLALAGVRLQPVARRQQSLAIDDRAYLQTTTVYSLFASQPGSLRVPALTYRGKLPVPTLADGSRQAGGNPRIVASSDSFEIRILAAPADDRVWFAASDVQIEAGLDGAAEPRAGEPFGYNIVVRADSQYAAAIPALAMPFEEPLRAYPSIPSLSETESELGISGTLRQAYTLLAARGGQFELPAVSIDWWDTQSRTWRVATLPAQTVAVAATGGDWRRWLWPLTIALAILSTLLAITALALWRRLRRLQRVDRVALSEPARWRNLIRQLRRGSAAQIRHAALAWIAARDASMVRIEQLAQADPALAAPLRKLDAVLYAGGDEKLLPADRRQLRLALKKLRKTVAAGSAVAELPALYPRP